MEKVHREYPEYKMNYTEPDKETFKGLEQTIEEFKEDGIKMKQLLLYLYAKAEGYNTIEELERKEGMLLENMEFVGYGEAGKTDKEDREMAKRKNENAQYIAKIKKDLE